MKMSDYFNLPIDSTGVVAINNHCTIQENNDGVAPYDAATLAINNHDKLVEMLKYFYKLPVDFNQVWAAGHLSCQHDAVKLLKELGHEI